MRENEANIPAILKRQEVKSVRFIFQETPKTNIKTFFITDDCLPDGRMNNKSDVFALADLFDGFKTQHGWTSLPGWEQSTSGIQRRE